MKTKIINSENLEYLKRQINNEIQDFYRWITQVQTEISGTQSRDQNKERINDLGRQCNDYNIRIRVCRNILIWIDEQTSEIEI